MGEARGHTIFCDDIRNEEGGKFSFMGVYRGSIIVHGDFPFLLPKFGLVVHYQEFREPPDSEPVSFRVFLPGDTDDAPSIEGSFPVEELRAIPHDDVMPLSEQLISLAQHFILVPFVLRGEGRIRVRAYRGTEEIKLGSLTVTQQKLQDAHGVASTPFDPVD